MAVEAEDDPHGPHGGHGPVKEEEKAKGVGDAEKKSKATKEAETRKRKAFMEGVRQQLEDSERERAWFHAAHVQDSD